MASKPCLTPSISGSGQERRKRARLGWSEATSSDSSDAGQFSIFSVPLRVAAPPPHPFPVVSEWDSQCTEIDKDIGKTTLVNGTLKILSTEKVGHVISVELVSRAPQRSNILPQGQPTILIVARWVDGCSVIWGRAVPKIKKFIDSKRLSSKNPDVDIAVEMIGEEHAKEKFMAPVTPSLLDRGLRTDWARIKDGVAQILGAFSQTKGHVTSIHLFRLGFSPDNDDNPNTVYISVDYLCQETKWRPVLEEIRKYLQHPRYVYANLCAHMEHGVIDQWAAFPLVPMTREDWEKHQKAWNLIPKKIPYTQRVDLGSDISVSKYIKNNDDETVSPLVGTLGCWLEIKTKSDPEWAKVALTNYHVIRPWYDGFYVDESDVGPPTAGSKLERMDKSGILPTENNRPILEHPSRAKHNHGVVRLKQTVARFGATVPYGKDARDKLKGIVSFFDNDEQRLGKVLCASGYKRRTANNGRLDWALIRPVANRVGGNTLPSLYEWGDKYESVTFFPDAETDGQPLKQPTNHGLRGLEHGVDHIYKVGTTTGVSVGIYSETKGDIKLSEDEEPEVVEQGKFKVKITQDQHVAEPSLSEEFAYIQGGQLGEGAKLIDQLFSAPGDSGSVAWDKKGRALGLVFRGQKPTGVLKTKLSYVTPIHDVFEDIKAFSEGGITDIRIAV